MVRILLLAAVAAMLPVPFGAGSAVTEAAPQAPVVSAPPPRPAVPGGWGWPLEPRPAVTRPFRVPPTPWSAGHRGVDLAGHVGQPVLSAGAGRVSFSGVVAGRGVVVVAHSGGLRTTYEPVDGGPAVGTRVARGDPLGVLSAVGSHCRTACLHWGLRDGETYRDPLLLLGLGPPVLLPLVPWG